VCKAAFAAVQPVTALMAKAGAVRKIVPWSMIFDALWGEGRLSFGWRIARDYYEKDVVDVQQVGSLEMQRITDCSRKRGGHTRPVTEWKEEV